MSGATLLTGRPRFDPCESTLRFVDEFVEGHSLQSLELLAELLGGGSS